MKLKEILLRLPQDAIENLARSRLSQVTDIRLPYSVLLDELAEVLGSAGHVSTQIALRHPPCFAILNLLMNSPSYSLSTDAFRQKVQEETDRMITLASRSPIFAKPKDYLLYLKMLEGAWEEEASINPSEANLLRILRDELGISVMEHFIIEHHPGLHRYWRNEQAYENERNHLRSTGILFSIEGSYSLPEETVALIRRSWGVELTEPQFRRLLDCLSNEDLLGILQNEELHTSGVAEEKKLRILQNYVPPKTALYAVNLESLREVARKLGCRAYGSKDEVIETVVDWLDSDEDLKKEAAAVEESELEGKQLPPEIRKLDNEMLAGLLSRVTNETLYDILSHLPRQRKSGSKSDRIKRLVESPFSEYTILRNVNNEVLAELCRQRAVSPYGPKEEKIARVIDSCSQSGVRPSILSTVPAETERAEEAPSPIPLEVQLPHLSEVQAGFPFLDQHQQIVVSCLFDFKSLSDVELEKLIQRFALPWILPKAQMVELIKRLQQYGKDIIRVRGLGDHNIYEMAI